jgi:hypothetical protein
MPETNPTVTVFEGLAPPNEGSESQKGFLKQLTPEWRHRLRI